MGVTSVVFVLFHFGFNLHVISIICISFSVPRMFSRQGGGGIISYFSCYFVVRLKFMSQLCQSVRSVSITIQGFG